MTEWCYSDANKNTEYHNCVRCKLLKNKKTELNRLPRVAIDNGRFLSDPDYPSNPHFCDPENDQKSSIGVALGKRKMFDVRDDINITKLKPKVQHDKAIQSVRIEFSTESEQIISNFSVL